MAENWKYDPEDIESLLRHKAFGELYESERNFVLRHLDSKEEYEAMRAALLLVDESNREEDFLKPRAKTKQALMQQFEEKGPRPVIWLNTWMGVDSLREKPVRALAIAASFALLVTTAVWWWNSPTQVPEIAEQVQSDTIEEKEIAPLVVEVPDSTVAPVEEQEEPKAVVVEKPKKTKPKIKKKPVDPAPDPVQQEPMLAQVESNPENGGPDLQEEPIGRNFAEDEALEALLYTAL